MTSPGEGVTCELCDTPTVHRTAESPSGVEGWRCVRCGDFKRWCPHCNQGWIRRFRVRATDTELYSCDECEAAWGSVAEMVADGISREWLLQRLGIAKSRPPLELVRESISAPPPT